MRTSRSASGRGQHRLAADDHAGRAVGVDVEELGEDVGGRGARVHADPQVDGSGEVERLVGRRPVEDEDVVPFRRRPLVGVLEQGREGVLQRRGDDIGRVVGPGDLLLGGRRRLRERASRQVQRARLALRRRPGRRRPVADVPEVPAHLRQHRRVAALEEDVEELDGGVDVEVEQPLERGRVAVVIGGRGDRDVVQVVVLVVHRVGPEVLQRTPDWGRPRGVRSRAGEGSPRCRTSRPRAAPGWGAS